MKLNIMTLCCGLFLLWSCGGNNNSDQKIIVNNADTTIRFAEGQADAKAHKIDFKSAIIHMQSSVMGMTQYIIVYIDDYGKKNVTDVTQELMGKKVSQYSLSDGDYMYSFSPGSKKGKKTKIKADSPDNINFNAITHEMADKFKLKKKGTAEVAGKKCEVYNLEFPGGKMKGTYYIWKGIPLKTETEVSMMNISMEATKVEENATIDPEKFVVPKDIAFD
jgi:hypothetical protein